MKKQPHSLSGRLWSGQPDPLARALGILVWPLGGLYGRLAALRAWAYSREIKASQTAGLPVISLGNLTVGGTGKTPFVLHLGRRLMERGFEPAVVLRGYGGRAGTGPVQVRPGMKAGDVGDEALMLAELSGLTVIAGSDRKAGAELAGRLGARMVLLDDGFQHLKLARSLDIVLVDAKAPLGNGRVFPAGPLREPPSALRRADAFIITRADDPEATDRTTKLLGRWAPNRPIWTARHVVSRAFDPASGEPESLAGARVLVAAGIARPGEFTRTVKGLGAAEVDLVPFSDHQRYGRPEIALLNQRAEAFQADCLVVTGKDWVKLAGLAGGLNRPVRVAELEIDLDGEESLLELIERTARAPGGPAWSIARSRRSLPKEGELLIRMPNWIGDAVMATPVLDNLRRGLPGWRLSLVATPWTAPLFEDDPRVERFIVYEPKGRHQGLAGRRRLAGELAGRFEAGLLLPNSFDSALIFRLAGLKRRIGYSRDGRRLLLTDPVPACGRLRQGHQIEYYLALLNYLGLAAPERIPRIFLPSTASAWAREWLAEKGTASGDRLIGLAPGAAFGPVKRWPAGRFSQAAKSLLAERPGRALLFGSPDEAELCAAIAQDIGPQAINLAGAASLVQAAALIARLDLLLTNDSGLMHLAAALERPLVALFGPTDPDKTGPRGRRQAILRAEADCAPCRLKACPKPRPCLEDIPAEAVVEAALKLIGP